MLSVLDSLQDIWVETLDFPDDEFRECLKFLGTMRIRTWLQKEISLQFPQTLHRDKVRREDSLLVIFKDPTSPLETLR